MDETQPAAKPKKETKIEKKLFLWLAILVVIWLVYISVAPMLPGTSNAQPGKETVSASFKALAGDQIVLDKTITVEKGANAFEEMKKIAQVETTNYPGIGVIVTSINSISPQENEFWALYVNGKMSEVGISQIALNEDTAIEWRIEGFA